MSEIESEPENVLFKRIFGTVITGTGLYALLLTKLERQSPYKLMSMVVAGGSVIYGLSKIFDLKDMIAGHRPVMTIVDDDYDQKEKPRVAIN